MGHTNFQVKVELTWIQGSGFPFNFYLNSRELFGQFQTELLPHARFNISTMMSKKFCTSCPLSFIYTLAYIVAKW